MLDLSLTLAGGVWSLWRWRATAVGVADQAPVAPTGLNAAAGNAQVNLTWNASTGATGYYVKRSTTSGSGNANRRAVDDQLHGQLRIERN